MSTIKQLAGDMDIAEFIEPSFADAAIAKANVEHLERRWLKLFFNDLKSYAGEFVSLDGTVDEFLKACGRVELGKVPNVGKKKLDAFERYLHIFSLALRGGKILNTVPLGPKAQAVLEALGELGHAGDDRWRELSIDEFDLSARVRNALVNSGIYTIGELVKSKESELRRIPNFGPISLKEIKDKLATRGLRLGMKS